MSTMSASDAAPLPRLGEVFFDVRGSSRSMRLSWYADTGVSVFSIWQGGTCTGTFRLPMEELSRLVDALQRGMPGADPLNSRGTAGNLNQLPGAPTDPRLTALPGYASVRDIDFTGPVTGDFRALRPEDQTGTMVFSPPSARGPRALPPARAALPPPPGALPAAALPPPPATPPAVPPGGQEYLEDYSAQYPEQYRPGRRRLPVAGEAYADIARYPEVVPGDYGDQGQYPGPPQYQEQAYPGPPQYQEQAKYQEQGQYPEQAQYQDLSPYTAPSQTPGGQRYQEQGYGAQRPAV